MVDAQAFEPGLRLGVERVVGRAHVGELRVGGDGRDDPGREHRVAARRVLERRVGVPEAIAERVHAPAVVGFQDLAVLVEVRDVGERLVPEAVLAEGAAPGLGVQLAVEALGERELLVVGERLIVEDQDGVLVHPRPDLGERLGIVDLAEVDRAHLGDEVRVELAEGQGHGREPRTTPGGESSVVLGAGLT